MRLRLLHKPVRHRPLTLRSSRSDFSFEFSEMFGIQKRLPDSPSQGVVFRLRILKCICGKARVTDKSSSSGFPLLVMSTSFTTFRESIGGTSAYLQINRTTIVLRIVGLFLVGVSAVHQNCKLGKKQTRQDL